MASQFQQVIYEGHLAEDPVMRFLPDGKPVTNFRIGSNREYTTTDGRKVKETTWLKVAAWGRMGEVINQYCDKGSHVIVVGVLKAGTTGSPEPYERRDGKGWAASYEITANSIRILKGKARANGETEEIAVDDSTEIPF